MRVFVFQEEEGYGVRISDWSSDVCSSDLGNGAVWKPPPLLCQSFSASMRSPSSARAKNTPWPSGHRLTVARPIERTCTSLPQRGQFSDSSTDRGYSSIPPDAAYPGGCRTRVRTCGPFPERFQWRGD